MSYLGYREGDAATPFGRFFRPEMAPLPAHVVEALSLGPVAPALLGGFETLPALLDDGYLPIETGLAVGRDGDLRVAVLTAMPGVSAEMWDWWFGWHGSDARRYKLWHPRAHVSASWADGPDRGRRDRSRYVGRTSLVDEYIGSTRTKIAIGFVPPSEVGLGETEPGGGRTFVCARLGSSQVPLDTGWLVHDVRPAADGCEMRSRFWLGGHHVRLRAGGPVLVDRVVARAAAALLRRQGIEMARALLVHCSQEMSHLASFLPDLHAELSRPDADTD